MIVVGALAVIGAVAVGGAGASVYQSERALVYGLGSALFVLVVAPIAGFVIIAVSRRAKSLGIGTGLLLGFSVLGLGGLCFTLVGG